MAYGIVVVKDELRSREALAEQQKNAEKLSARNSDPGYYRAMEHFSRKSDSSAPK
jgi:hypothetical protein